MRKKQRPLSILKKEEFIIEYFKQVRGELTTRVQIHTNLILQKVATCGAALGFMLSQKTVASDSLTYVQLLGFAFIPIIAMGYDVLIARNINNLHRLGTFIRNELEPLVPELSLWETKYGQPKKNREHPILKKELTKVTTAQGFQPLVKRLMCKIGMLPKNNPRNHGINPRNHGNAEIIFLSSFTLMTEIIAIVIYFIYWGKSSIYLAIIISLFLLLSHIFVFIYMRRQILRFDTFEKGKN